MESIKVTYEEYEPIHRISKLSATRWTVRANCFQRIIENYDFLYDLWDECLKESGLNRDVKSRIIGCKAKMGTLIFYFGLKLGKLLFKHTDKLSQTLQSKKMSAVSSKRIAMLTVKTISNLRNSENFDALYDLCLKEIQKFQFIEEPVLKRKRKEPRYSLFNVLDGYESRSEAHHSITHHDHYWKHFYQAIDVLISSVHDQFNQPSFLAFENLESLLIKTLKNEDTSVEMKFSCENYGSNIILSDLHVDLATFKVLMEGKQIEHFHDLLKEMRLLETPQKKFLVNVCSCKILVVNPESSATSKRTFSLARRVKTWMRSSMLPTRFNSISILNFHKDRTDKLDVIKIANAFVQSDDNRKRVFGKFTKEDL